MKFKRCIALAAFGVFLINPFLPIARAEEATQAAPAAPITSSPAQTPTVPVQDPTRGNQPSDHRGVQPVTTEAPKTVTVPEANPSLSPVPVDENGKPESTTPSNNATNDNDNKTTVDDQTNTTNNSTTQNDATGTADTGNNMVTNERGDVNLSTGDAKLALSILNMINSLLLTRGNVKFVVKNADGINQDIAIDPKTGDISILGKGPQVVGNIFDSSFLLNNTNSGDLVNNVDLKGDTGSNTVTSGVGDVNIDTGNVNMSLNLLNFLNSTFAATDFGSFNILNIFGTLNGNIDLKNFAGSSKTTPEEAAIAEKIKQLLTIETNNNSDINNKINIDGNTGYNSISAGRGDANISTGSVNELLNIRNLSNLNFIGDKIYVAIVNVLGKWNGKKLLDPIVMMFTDGGKTTSNPTNEGLSQTINNSANTNNSGLITNLLNLLANTGGNSVSSERGDVNITTGNVNLISNIFNFSNFNVYANKFVFYFINIFGDWNGNFAFGNESVKPEETVKSVKAVNNLVATKKVVRPVSFSDYITYGKNVQDADPIISDFSEGQGGGVGSNPFNFEKPQTSVLTSYILDNFNTIMFYAFLAYLLVLVAYFARRKSRIR